MPGRLPLSEDSGDGISISVQAGRHILIAFRTLKKSKSGRSTISQSTDPDEKKTIVYCCSRHLGDSGNHHYIKRNRGLHDPACRKSLVAASDYCSCPCRILPDVPQNCGQILWQDRVSAGQGKDMADFSGPWMDPACIYDGTRNRTKAYSWRSVCFYRFILFRPGSDASSVLRKIFV